MHGKSLPKQMITPEEAVKLLDWELADVRRIVPFVNAYVEDQKRFGGYEHRHDAWLHAFLFDAGRIQGIREERARRKLKS